MKRDIESWYGENSFPADHLLIWGCVPMPNDKKSR